LECIEQNFSFQGEYKSAKAVAIPPPITYATILLGHFDVMVEDLGIFMFFLHPPTQLAIHLTIFVGRTASVFIFLFILW
jgi:hypothetical protein